MSIDEISTAIKSINTGKAEDIFGMFNREYTVAGNEFLNHLYTLIYYIFSNRLIPDVIKTGLLSPVYKNKGDNHQTKNYRGIVVLPVFVKIIEYIARTDLKTLLLQNQSVLQRGFTENTSPTNAALIVEELYREFEDKNKPFYLALLDAKSAFDVVVLSILFRKLYMLGINPATWTVVDELHRNTRSCVKWNDCISDEINVQQGVKQGGLLSADLYKLYIEDLLHYPYLTGNGHWGTNRRYYRKRHSLMI